MDILNNEPSKLWIGLKVELKMLILSFVNYNNSSVDSNFNIFGPIKWNRIISMHLCYSIAAFEKMNDHL